MDTDLRSAERDPESEARLVVAKLRSGELSPKNAKLLAYCQHKPTQEALGWELVSFSEPGPDPASHLHPSLTFRRPGDGLEWGLHPESKVGDWEIGGYTVFLSLHPWASGMAGFGFPACARAILAAAYHRLESWESDFEGEYGERAHGGAFHPDNLEPARVLGLNEPRELVDACAWVFLNNRQASRGHVVVQAGQHLRRRWGMFERTNEHLHVSGFVLTANATGMKPPRSIQHFAHGFAKLHPQCSRSGWPGVVPRVGFGQVGFEQVTAQMREVIRDELVDYYLHGVDRLAERVGTEIPKLFCPTCQGEASKCPDCVGQGTYWGVT